MSLVKVARGERARIEQLIMGQESRIRSAFRRFFDDVRSEAVRRQVRIALERGAIEDALRVVDAHVLRLGGALTQSFQSVGALEAAALARVLPRAVAHIAVSFDPTWPRAAELMRQNRLEFVREFTRAQREATRAALVESFQVGSGPVDTARAFRESIGLTERQRQMVANYRRLLERGDAAALARELRDRRFDPSVRRMLQTGEPLGARRINRMVVAYRNRFVQYRAETIARVEGLRVAGAARHEALVQAVEQSGMPRDAVIRTWRDSDDARVRETHEQMDGQQRGLDEPFTSPSGARLMYPGDRTAPAEEVINCRCAVLHEFRRVG